MNETEAKYIQKLNAEIKAQKKLICDLVNGLEDALYMIDNDLNPPSTTKHLSDLLNKAKLFV